jgi:pimeloyl-ACP methyl ester carboxylesterase
VKKCTYIRVFALGLVLVFLGVLIAALNQTDMGRVKIKQLSVVSDEGNAIKAVMYLPENASKETPAPCLLAVHGGNSSRYAMSNIAQEFARRGFVVVSIDQSLNGQSDRAVNDYLGSEIVMKYIKTLEFVDQNKLATIGHSAGGGVTSMVVANPQFEVNACINLGVGPSVTPDVPINLAVIIGIADENTGPRGADTAVTGPGHYAKSSALARAFGVEEGTEVVPGKDYGSLDAHNHRIFYQPACGHLGALFSTEAISLSLQYAARVLNIEYKLNPDSQSWVVRELATAVAYIGMFVAVFGFVSVMLMRKKLMLHAPAQGHARPNLLYWIGLAIFVAVPAIGIQNLYMTGRSFFTSISTSVFAMEHINGVIFWMLCTALIILVANLILKKLDREYDWSFDKSILVIDRKKLLNYALIAVCTFLICYGMVYLAGFFGNVCIRLYNTEVHLFTATRFNVFWVYLPMYLLYYAIIGYVQTSSLLCKKQPVWSQYVRTIIVSIAAPSIMLLIWYGSCIFTGDNPLFVWRFVLGVLLNFLPGMAVGAGIQVFSYRKTGNIWQGAFINSILFSWMATSIGVMNAIVR